MFALIFLNIYRTTIERLLDICWITIGPLFSHIEHLSDYY